MNRYGCHLDSLASYVSDVGPEKAARINMDIASKLLARGERETATLYLNRAQWALDAKERT